MVADLHGQFGMVFQNALSAASFIGDGAASAEYGAEIIKDNSNMVALHGF